MGVGGRIRWGGVLSVPSPIPLVLLLRKAVVVGFTLLLVAEGLVCFFNSEKLGEINMVANRG